MSARSYDELIQRISNGFWASNPVWGQTPSSSVTFGANAIIPQRLGFTQNVPNPLPTNVGAALVSRLSSHVTGGNLQVLFGWLTRFGSLNLSTNGFSDNTTMPLLTELGTVNNPSASSIIVEVKSATLNATPGNLTLTYQDQDGHVAESGAAWALGASATFGQAGWYPLNAGDWGARDITNAVQSGGGSPTGLIDIIGMVPLSIMSCSPNAFGIADNILTHHFNLPRLPANAEIGAYVIQNTGAKGFIGELFMIGDS